MPDCQSASAARRKYQPSAASRLVDPPVRVETFIGEQVQELPSMNSSLLHIAHVRLRTGQAARRIPQLLTLVLLVAATSASAADVGGLPRAGFLGTQLAA